VIGWEDVGFFAPVKWLAGKTVSEMISSVLCFKWDVKPYCYLLTSISTVREHLSSGGLEGRLSEPFCAVLCTVISTVNTHMKYKQ